MISEFVWRRTCAKYDSDKKTIELYSGQMLTVPWRDWPSEAEEFINWLALCQSHIDGITDDPPATREYY